MVRVHDSPPVSQDEDVLSFRESGDKLPASLAVYDSCIPRGDTSVRYCASDNIFGKAEAGIEIFFLAAGMQDKQKTFRPEPESFFAPRQNGASLESARASAVGGGTG
jgi:hypothetical protein